MRNLILMMLMSGACLFAQTDLVFPWVTNNSLFRSTVVINNIGDSQAAVSLTATRADGSTETKDVVLAPFAQLVSSANDLFTALGEGPGYAVRVTSDASNIKGALVVSGTGSPSGSSPAQADVLDAASASPVLLFNYLPLSSGFSAPVLVNMGDTSAEIRLHAFQGGQLVASSASVTVESGRPFTGLATDLLPGLGGDVYVAAESTQPMVGMAFIFNDQREPSMSAATAISAVPNPPTTGIPTSGVFDTNLLKGTGFAHDLIRDNIVEFNTLGAQVGVYAFLGAVQGWPVLQTLLPGFIDDNLANGEAVNVILDFDRHEEVSTTDPNGAPSGTGTPVGGVVLLVADTGDGTLSTLFLNVPTAEGMATLYQWFQLGE